MNTNTDTGQTAPRAGGVKLPPVGTYAGTVGGEPAIIAVGKDCVWASWYVPTTRPGEYMIRDNAWDVSGGRFFPVDRFNDAIACTIARRKSPRPSDRRPVGKSEDR